MTKIRLMLPVLAVMFAIAGAFATNSSKKSGLLPDPVVKVQAGCQLIGRCSGGSQVCKEATTNIQYYWRIDAETCASAATGNFSTP